MVEDESVSEVLKDPRYGPGTFERVRHAVWYSPEDGRLYRKVAVGKAKVGDRAGFYSENYKARMVMIGGVLYNEDILCYLLGTGELPKGKIRHLNGDKLDNRLRNLQDWVCQDDPARGVFENVEGKWEIRLYTRGRNGRSLFGVYEDRGMALFVAEKAVSLLGNGVDPRKVKTMIGSRGTMKGGAGAKVRTKELGDYATYVPVTLVPSEGEKLKSWETVADADTSAIAVSGLRHERRVDELGWDGHPLYGPFYTMEEASAAVEAYYQMRNSGSRKLESMEAAGMQPLKVVRVVGKEVTVRAGKRDPVKLLHEQRRGMTALKKAKEKWERGEDILVEVEDKEGRKRWIVEYLPEAPVLGVVHKYIAIKDGGTAAFSKKDTLNCVLRYQELRKAGKAHHACMQEAGLRRWDDLSGTFIAEFAGDTDLKAMDKTSILPYEDGDVILYLIRGLRKPHDDACRDMPDYVGFETARDATVALDSYRGLLTDPKLMWVPQGEKKFHSRHDAALFYSGLLKMRRL